MSAETAEKSIVKEKKSEAYLSKRRKKIIADPLNDDNPITIQVLRLNSLSSSCSLVIESSV